jgi:hypothetical protein
VKQLDSCDNSLTGTIPICGIWTNKDENVTECLKSITNTTRQQFEMSEMYEQSPSLSLGRKIKLADMIFGTFV